MQSRHLILLAMCLATMPRASAAQVTKLVGPAEPAAKAPAVVQLVLYPAPEPKPALKYHLLPPLLDRKPGNAAVLYNKAVAERYQFYADGKAWEQIVKWMEMPLAELPKGKDREELARTVINGPELNFVHEGARCESCDWQLPFRDGNYIAMLLPDLQQSRGYTRFLSARIRFQLADGRFDDAIYNFQTGYALARHTSHGQTLVHGLVAIAMSGMMSSQLFTMIQQPGAPNLYWALAELPDPIISIAAGMEAENASLFLSIPELKNVESKEYSADYWGRVLVNLLSAGSALGMGNQNSEFNKLTAAGLAVWGYPLARQSLIDSGRNPAEIDAMSIPQVLLLYSVRTYEELRDEEFKWWNLPYPEARQHADRRDLGDRARSREVLPLAQVLLPAVASVHRAQVRAQREIAFLQLLEALRMYGANHEGRLPDKLADLSEAPAPNDPVTGKPFDYRRQGDAAVIALQGYLVGYPKQASDPEPDLRFEIRLAKKGN